RAVKAPQSPLSPGQISDPSWASNGPDNTAGYCGYQFNPQSQLYTVRFRHYSPEFGRWLEPDPAGYVGGMGWDEYCDGAVMRVMDPFGLEPDPKTHGFYWTSNPGYKGDQRVIWHHKYVLVESSWFGPDLYEFSETRYTVLEPGQNDIDKDCDLDNV